LTLNDNIKTLAIVDCGVNNVQELISNVIVRYKNLWILNLTMNKLDEEQLEILAESYSEMGVIDHIKIIHISNNTCPEKLHRRIFKKCIDDKELEVR